MDVRITIEEAPQPEPEFGLVVVCPEHPEPAPDDPFEVEVNARAAGRGRHPEDVWNAFGRFVRVAADMFNAVSFGDAVMPTKSFRPFYHPDVQVPAGLEFEFAGLMPARSPVFGDFPVPEGVEPDRAFIIRLALGEYEVLLTPDEFEMFDFLDEDEVASDLEELPDMPAKVAGLVDRAGRGVTVLRDRKTGIAVWQWRASPSSIEKTARQFGPHGFDVVTFC